MDRYPAHDPEGEQMRARDQLMQLLDAAPAGQWVTRPTSMPKGTWCRVLSDLRIDGLIVTRSSHEGGGCQLRSKAEQADLTPDEQAPSVAEPIEEKPVESETRPADAVDPQDGMTDAEAAVALDEAVRADAEGWPRDWVAPNEKVEHADPVETNTESWPRASGVDVTPGGKETVVQVFVQPENADPELYLMARWLALPRDAQIRILSYLCDRAETGKPA